MEKGKPVFIDEAALAEMLESVPDGKSTAGREFTPTEDAFIIAVWEKKKNKEIAAKRLGICEVTMRKRYLHLKDAEGNK
jgi:hypothetical protein